VLADLCAHDAVASAAFIGRIVGDAAERGAERCGDRRDLVAHPVRNRLGHPAVQGRGRRDGDARLVLGHDGGQPHRVRDAATVRAVHRRQHLDRRDVRGEAELAC
jgi:hypothetical protein